MNIVHVFGMERFVEDVHVDHIIIHRRRHHFQHGVIPLEDAIVLLCKSFIIQNGKHTQPDDLGTVLLE
jgi:hypothetical protein